MKRFAAAVLPMIALLALEACAKSGGEDEAKQRLLIDRMEITDLLDNVYDNVETASTTDFDKYYLPDAVFDVNGTAYKGKQAILDYHAQVAKTSPHLKGVFHMLVDNVRVKVDGNRAATKLLFTGILAPNLTGDPTLFKHGREYDLLARQSDGSWKFAKRVIVSDASAGSDFADVERPGEDYDILKDK
ncbi:MAG: SgcJ/EcaC family oxidoreductase [Novosphingobium sp.]|nr:SgcJ/EcaC family oxidoreductase [Novosphingobium sp.]